MSVTIPPELEKAVKARADQRRMTVEDLVHEALSWYLGTDWELVDELCAWQEVRDEARRIVEGSE
ncbi:MAG: hypothetical protein HY721_05655 [Planctomycetes bacterium]|nr:hypothetical protein [Planctomycetota bacterium]